MIKGLQITLSGEELSRRIGERIRVHEVAISALDARLVQRRGDQPFDVRDEDGFKTVGELENERQQYLDRVTPLTLIRNNLVEGEVYALSRADLQAAELIGSAGPEGLRVAELGPIDGAENAAIDGLKLKFTGNELRELVERRMQHHERCAERWQREQARTPEDETEDAPLYERETSIGFNLERLTKEIGRAVPALTRAGDRIDRDEQVTTRSAVTMVGCCSQPQQGH